MSEDKNYTLQELRIQQCQRYLGGILPLSPSLKLYLKLNRVGRLWLLRDPEHNSTVEDWVDMIATYRNSLDIVYYFLKKRPDTLLMNPQLYKMQASSPPLKRRKLLHLMM